jgi:error-prone DNA polymerase
LVVRGTLERVDTVINVVADKLELLPLAVAAKSRDFR